MVTENRNLFTSDGDVKNMQSHHRSITVTRVVPKDPDDCAECDFFREAFGKGMCYIFNQPLKNIGNGTTFAGTSFIEKKYHRCDKCADNIKQTQKKRVFKCTKCQTLEIKGGVSEKPVG